MFLQYEELKRDPIVQVKRLASFLEWSFNNEGEIDEVTWRCSLERHKDLEGMKWRCQIVHFSGLVLLVNGRTTLPQKRVSVLID